MRIPRLTASEVESILSANGFARIGQKGSHRKWWNPATRSVVIVPFHVGKILPLGTLKQIMLSSGIEEAKWHS